MFMKLVPDITILRNYGCAQVWPSQIGITNAPPTYEVRKSVALILCGMALGILGLNVALALQNRTLKEEIAAPPAMLPSVGAKVRQLQGVALDGSKIQVLFTGQGKRTLLFVFSTECGVCDLNWPQWDAIARSVQSKQYRLVYANIQSALTNQYVQQYGIKDALVFARLDPRSEVALNLRLQRHVLIVGT
ncbi:MAG: hypothetical protein ACRD4A_10360 [Candidatus Acidiferrales bacterium]